MNWKPLILCLTLTALGACGTPTNTAVNATQPPVPTAGSLPTAENLPTLAPHAEAVLEEPTQMPTTAALPAEAPTSAPAVKHSVQRVVIEEIKLDETTVPVGLDENRVPIVPKHEVGWYTLSAGPGDNENIVLWGHVLRFKATPNIPAPFQRVKELKPGAEITVYDEANVAHRYTVAEQVQVTPDEIKYILPTGSEQLTLVSCIGDKVRTEVGVEMTRRLITIAKPVE